MAAIISRWVFFQIGINRGFFLTGYFSEVPSETAPVAPKSAFWVRVEQFKPTRTERGGKYYFKRQTFSISRPRFNAVKWNTSANRNKWGKWRKISPLCIRREAERRKLEVYLGKDLGFFLFFFSFSLWIPNKSFLRWVFINYLSQTPTPRTRTRPRSVFLGMETFSFRRGAEYSAGDDLGSAIDFWGIGELPAHHDHKILPHLIKMLTSNNNFPGFRAGTGIPALFPFPNFRRGGRGCKYTQEKKLLF